MENNIEQPANEEELSYHNLSLVEIAKLSYEEYPRYKLSRMQYLEIKAMYQNGYEEGLNAGRKLLEETRAETEKIRRETAEILKKREEIRKETEKYLAKVEEERRQKEEYLARIEAIDISMRKTAKAILQSGSSKEEVAKLFSISLDELEAWLNHP